MFSKKNNLFSSLKFRLITIFTSLLLLLTGTTFLWTYQSLVNELDKRLQQKLEQRHEALMEEYEEELHKKRHSKARRLQEALEEFDELVEQKQESMLQSREWACLLSADAKIISQSKSQGIIQQQELFLKKITLPKDQKTEIISDGHKSLICFIKRNSDNSYLLIATDHQENLKLLQHYRDIFLLAFIAISFFGAMLCARTIKSSLAGVEKVRNTVEKIKAHGDYNHRVQVSPKSGSEIAELAESFNSMLNQTQILIKEIQEVTNNVAHDLRTPLTRIRGQVETTLMANADLNQYQELGGIVIEECDTLIAIINDMLTLSEYESGLVPSKSEKICLNDIVLELCDIFSSVADDKEISLIHKIPSAKIYCTGDNKKLQRALANLLDNAIKYSSAKSDIHLEMSIENGKAIVNITDSGCGISTDDQKRIFERFYRVDRSRNKLGNGLGLNLAKAFIEYHSGKLTLESIIGKGSTFTVEIPLAEPPKKS